MGNYQLQNQHLLWRAGFGPSTPDLHNLAEAKPAETYLSLVKASAKKPGYFNPANNLVQGFMMGLKNAKRKNEDADAKTNKRKQFARQSRELIKDLNLVWIDEMASSNAQLTEKMALFWHGHFACRNLNVYFQQTLLHDIRTHALGNFGDLLMAVSKSPAMLAFLNNQQNRKSQPNENFAREVMELFTLGRGNYTEADVKEAARAFTGWGFNLQGEFVFKRFQHDAGQKNVLGRKGNLTGEDVISILLEQKQTAIFVTRKLYRYLVNDTPNEQHVQWLAGRFYQSKYDIAGLLQDIFTSNWFYEANNIACLIKSPVQLLVGLRRTLPMQLKNPGVQLLMQRALGQVLFYPPNVAGWPGGKNWIDSSALMLRLRLPQMLAGNDVLSIATKDDDDQQMGMMENVDLGNKKIMALTGNRFKMETDVNWPHYIKQFETVARPQLLSTLEGVMLQTTNNNAVRSSIEKVADTSSRDAYIKSVSVAFMSTPEYQLC